MRKIRIILILLAVLMLIPAYGITINAAEESGSENTAEIIEQDDTYEINIINSYPSYGFALANRRTAKAGDTVIIGAFGKEYTVGKQSYKYEIKGWYSDTHYLDIVKINDNLAYFYMPEGDVTIYPIFQYTDLTEYYDWDSVIASVKSARTDSIISVNMENETDIPIEVLQTLKGKNVSVTFIGDGDSFTVNGNDITEIGSEKYMLKHKEADLSTYIKRKIGKKLIASESVSISGKSNKLSAMISIPVKSKYDAACVYKSSGFGFEFVSLIDISDGTADFMVSDSGNYIITSAAIKNTVLKLDADSEYNTVLFDGKIVPISAVIDGKLTFKVEYSAPIEQMYIAKNYNDVRGHTFKPYIDFINARELIDGTDDFLFSPDNGITVIDLLTAFSRIRGIEDKEAYRYAYQLEIITQDYPEEYILTRNDMSEIFTNFINHIMEYPKSYDGYTMSGFGKNTVGWVGTQMLELNKINGNNTRFDWNQTATRAEAAYMLYAVINTIVTGG